MKGWDTAHRVGGPWLANKLRYSRPGARLDAVRRLGALDPRRVRIYDDPSRFLKDPDVEAVWVASPPDLHAEHSVAALQSGKHVLCEKPLAAALADARAMVAAARQTGQRLAVGYHMRQHPAHCALQKSCVAGALGQLEAFEAALHFRHPNPRPWHKRKVQSGGWAICEAGTHLVDLALWFLGATDAPVAAEAELSSARLGFETDDRASLLIRFRSGATARLNIDAAAETPSQWFEITGSLGRVRCEETLFGQNGTLTRFERDGPSRTPVAPVNLHALQVESFSRALRGDREAVVVSAEDGLANLELIAQARGW
jgi:1,5-anhydro-D-fructose reductase (1,5-anhydro-D-mannitol-forming)